MKKKFFSLFVIVPLFLAANNVSAASVSISQKYYSGTSTKTTIEYTATVTPQSSGYTYKWFREYNGQDLAVTSVSGKPYMAIYEVPSIAGSMTMRVDVYTGQTLVASNKIVTDVAQIRDSSQQPTGDSSQQPGGGDSSQQPAGTGTTSPSGSSGTSTKLINPIPQDNLLDLVISLIKSFMAILAIFAVGMIVWGGFRFVISAGNEASVKAAKSTITWAIVGLVIALLSYSIVAIVENLLKAN